MSRILASIFNHEFFFRNYFTWIQTFFQLLRKNMLSDMAVHFGRSAEAEVLQVQVQPGLYSKALFKKEIGRTKEGSEGGKGRAREIITKHT